MNDSSDKPMGALYVVATPIGNLNDITLRAIEVLHNCDLVACEDTRHSKRLFQAHGIDTKTKSLHQHNENQDSAYIIKRIQAGENVALISDAGTPLINDPGYPLLQLAHQHDIRVIPIPGPSALTALLSVAAINTQPFTFHGFLPAKSQQRMNHLKQWLPLNATHVFYESSHRILACVEQLAEVFTDDALVVMGRELTKTFEQIFRGQPSSLLAFITQDKNHQKGEFVLAIQGSHSIKYRELTDEQARLASALKTHLPPKVAAKVVAEHYDINKKMVYEFISRQAKT